MSGVAYLCSYIPRPRGPNESYDRSPLGEARILTRGFACLPSELLTEIETACRAKRGTLSYECISPEAVDAWRDHYRQNGGTIYLNREGFE